MAGMRRRLRLLDAMITVCAIALGLAFLRFSVGD
jgi:hypothetical protein